MAGIQRIQTVREKRRKLDGTGVSVNGEPACDRLTKPTSERRKARAATQGTTE